MRRLIVLVLLLALPMGHRVAHSAPTLANMTVDLLDLPTQSFVLYMEHGSRAALAKQTDIAWETPQLVGLAEGDARLYGVGDPDPHYPSVLAMVGRYTSITTAQVAYLASARAIARWGKLTIGQVGDERIARLSTSHNVTAAVVAFRRGALVVYLALIRPTKAYPILRVRNLAYLVDTRIQHAL